MCTLDNNSKYLNQLSSIEQFSINPLVDKQPEEIVWRTENHPPPHQRDESTTSKHEH